jgi:hypothetical protein
VVLQLRSLGHNEVAVVKLDGGQDYAALVEHYYAATDPTPKCPSWATEVVRLELNQDGGEAKGVSRLVSLTPIVTRHDTDFWRTIEVATMKEADCRGPQRDDRSQRTDSDHLLES